MFEFLLVADRASKSLQMTIQNSEYLGSEGYALVGAAFEVHREIGGGMSEDESARARRW